MNPDEPRVVRIFVDVELMSEDPRTVAEALVRDRIADMDIEETNVLRCELMGSVLRAEPPFVEEPP